MEVGNIQQVFRAFGKPLLASVGLTLRAVRFRQEL
jgi:hypothetical protein